MANARPKKKRGVTVKRSDHPCACGREVIKKDSDFLADVEALVNHTRTSCRPMKGAFDFGGNHAR